jgi:hypothetical protein
MRSSTKGVDPAAPIPLKTTRIRVLVAELPTSKLNRNQLLFLGQAPTFQEVLDTSVYNGPTPNSAHFFCFYTELPASC